MKIKKDDVLYRYTWEAVSDKDYCTDDLIDNYDCTDICPNYKKCYQRAQKIVLQKVTITKKTFNYYGTPKVIRHYNAVDLKYWKKKVGNFTNNGYKVNVKIEPYFIDEWAKSEPAALKKVNARLKERIKKIKNKTLKYSLEWEIPRLQKYIDLQKKIEGRLHNDKKV